MDDRMRRLMARAASAISTQPDQAASYFLFWCTSDPNEAEALGKEIASAIRQSLIVVLPIEEDAAGAKGGS